MLKANKLPRLDELDPNLQGEPHHITLQIYIIKHFGAGTTEIL